MSELTLEQFDAAMAEFFKSKPNLGLCYEITIKTPGSFGSNPRFHIAVAYLEDQERLEEFAKELDNIIAECTSGKTYTAETRFLKFQFAGPHQYATPLPFAYIPPTIRTIFEQKDIAHPPLEYHDKYDLGVLQSDINSIAPQYGQTGSHLRPV